MRIGVFCVFAGLLSSRFTFAQETVPTQTPPGLLPSSLTDGPPLALPSLLVPPMAQQVPTLNPRALTGLSLPGTPLPGAGPTLVENLQSFDPMTLNLVWADNCWRLVAGAVVLKDFGRKEAEGRQALRLIRELRLNQHGAVGWPNPVMEYWLVDGRPPRGHVAGWHGSPFDAVSLAVEESRGQWCVRDNRHVLFSFGTNGDVARQARDVLRKYAFSEVIAVGQPPSMLVFLAGSSDVSGDPRIVRGSPLKPTASHDSAETAARKEAELKRMQDRFPNVGGETIVQPAIQPLHTPNQPRAPFSSRIEEFHIKSHKPPSGASAAPAEASAARVPFDWRQVQVKQDGADYKLAAGGLVLANFGRDVDSAQRALETVRYYRFTEQCTVGGPERCFTYYLCAGQAPRGVPFGVAAEAFRADALEVRQLEGTWSLCDRERIVVRLGKREDDALELLKVIQRQRLDHFCRIGPVETSAFTFLARSR